MLTCWSRSVAQFIARRRLWWQGNGRAQHRRDNEGGFTLVEVIVALAILSLGLSVLLGSMSGSLRQTANAARMAEASALAQSLLAEVGTGLQIKPEDSFGQFRNGYRWHLKMQPYGGVREREEWPVGAYQVSTEVEWEEGTSRRSYVLTTLRLGPKAVRQ
jgi:general secretion pathway protein I